MATKTISIDLSAYERLTMARNYEKVILFQGHQACFVAEIPSYGQGLLDALESMPCASNEVIHEVDANQSLDLPPSDKWA